MARIHCCAVVAILMVATTSLAEAQTLYRRLPQLALNDESAGRSLDGPGDVDGDGLADVLIGAQNFPDFNQARGRVQIVSGATAQVVMQFIGTYQFARLGKLVAGVGDQDGDGRADFVYSVDDYPAPTARVVVRSGGTGAALLEIPLPFWPTRLTRVGDLDGDGREDLGVTHMASGTGGHARAYSLASGALLFQMDGATNEALGAGMGDAGDVDGDSRDDVYIGSGGFVGTVQSPANGRVRVFSGATQQVVLEVLGQSGGVNNIGHSAASAGDFDGDGFDDLFIATRRGVGLHSGATGARRYYHVAMPGTHPSVQVRGLDDLDGDLVRDFVLLTAVYDTTASGVQLSGFARIVSGANGQTLATLQGVLQPVNWEFGPHIATLGDADGDGRDEFALAGVSYAYEGWVDVFSFHHGSAFCGGLPNSTGATGELVLQGSVVVARDLTTLAASSLPPGSLTMLLAARAQGSGVVVGSGLLCLTGPIGRFSAPLQLQVASLAGSATFVVPLQSLPTPLGLVPAMPGDTWTFQAWHRDTLPGGNTPTSNLTQGVAITFR